MSSVTATPTTSSPGAADAEAGAVADRRRVPFTVRELLLAWGLLGVLSIVVFLPYVRHGGFYLDDWANGALALHPAGGGFSTALDQFWDLGKYRPVLVLYVPLTFELFGAHFSLHLAWTIALCVVVSGALYGVLRTLGVARVHSWMIAALVLVFPWSDSTRLWATASQISLSMAFAFTGIWLALVGLERRSWRWHAGALALYALSILSYEVTLPLLAAMGVVYTLRYGWGVAWKRWAADLVVVGICALWVGTQTVRKSYGFSADFRHLRQIIDQGSVLLGRSVTATGPQRTTLTLLVLLVAGLLAAAAWRGLPDLGAEQRAAGRRWLLLGLGGVAVAFLGWVMFIPADPYYTPAIWGMTNRVNGLAAVGLVIAVYSAAGLVGSLVSVPLRNAATGPRVALGVTVALGLVLGGTYISVLHRHTKIWEAAYRAERVGLGQIRGQFRTLPEGSVVYAAGYPTYQTLGVPIFAASWDVNGMIKLQYHDASLAAYPVIEGDTLTCTAGGVVFTGPSAGSPAPTPYGKANFLNASTGQHDTPRSLAQCRRQVRDYVAGPLYLSYSY
jgi:hypothetical protein